METLCGDWFLNVMDVEKEVDGKKTTAEETLNSRQAIWLRPKGQIKEEEYKAFYKQVSRDFEDPEGYVFELVQMRG